MQYFIFEEGKATKESTNIEETLAYFDSRRNSTDKGNYLSFGFSENVSKTGGHCMDILACKGGQLYRINDYKNIAPSDEIHKEVNELVKFLCDRYNVQLQFTTDKLLSGISGCLIPVENESNTFTYMNDKIPLSASNMKIKSCINEVCVENRGYIPYEKFVYENTFSGVPEKFPVIKMVNVSYVNLSGGVGQADLLPEEYFQFARKYSKEYKLAMYDEHLDKYLSYASFDDKQEAVKRSFDLGIPYLRGNSDVFVVDSKGYQIFVNKLTESNFLEAEELGVDFSKKSEPFPNGFLYAENLDDFYLNHEYYSGKIENEIPDGSSWEHFQKIKGKRR